MSVQSDHLLNKAHSVWMVRPSVFAYNPETAASNSFQSLPGMKPEEVHRLALSEFDAAVKKLQAAGIDVLVSQSDDEQAPDAVFPNNWISTHPGGTVMLYPMQSPSRRRERDPRLLDMIRDRFVVKDLIDLSGFEREGRYLEGTGSMVFDHSLMKVYAALSPRTDAFLVSELASLLEFEPVIFHAVNAEKQAVYHTNVVMNIGTAYAIVCMDAVADAAERDMLRCHLEQNDRTLIPISMEQMGAFCGNMLELSNTDGELITVCSASAFNALSTTQTEQLSALTRLLVVDIPVIEQAGGGSIRCMLTEIYLKGKT